MKLRSPQSASVVKSRAFQLRRTAESPTSRSLRSSSEAYCKAWPYCCTAAHTTSLSPRTSVVACCNAAPDSITAAKTTSRSRLSSSAAYSSARPSARTAAKTMSRLPLRSSSRSSRSSRPSSIPCSAAASATARTRPRLADAMLRGSTLLSFSSSCRHRPSRRSRCATGGVPSTRLTSALTSRTRQPRSALMEQRASPERPPTIRNVIATGMAPAARPPDNGSAVRLDT
mmetsp:Transcript_112065/g.340987  ORF Transcript_112065/g.340987 Transcript_112065/m.340987 type:complete len:229 (-) Transcript_112065:8-694(-)